jgi:prepilin-type processing-associated H-X9-DG protein
MKVRDVLILVAILALGGGLLISWIARLRGRAAETQCTHNLKGVGWGLLNHHDVFKVFPQATIPNPSLPPEKRLSWLVEIEPYALNGGNCKCLVNRTKAWDSEENQPPKFSLYNIDTNRLDPPTPYGQLIQLYCPGSAADPEKLSGVTHYVGIAGLGENAAFLPADDKRAGFFGHDRALTATSDGAENTIAIAETEWRNGAWTAGGHPTVRGLAEDGFPYFGKGREFGGMHRGGCMVFFADGSVHLLSDAIDSRTFDALVTVAGGEKLEDGRW